MAAKKLKVLALGLSVSMVALVSCTDDKEPENAEETVAASDTITVGEAEQRVREIVSLDGQELRSTLLINSEDALVSLKQIAPESVTQKVEVGDFFIVFSETQVVYRPSTDRVVQTVPVLKADITDSSAAETETTQ